MKILAEIDTNTHTVIELGKLDQIINRLESIEQSLKRKTVEKVSVSLREAAEMLGCTYSYVKELYHDGKLRGRQDGKGAVVFIDYESVIDFIKKGQPNANGHYIETSVVAEVNGSLSDEQMVALSQKLVKKKRK